MKDNFYFTTSATETEHSFLYHIFKDELEKLGYELIYYRKFKTGHVPMEREVKTNAPRWIVLQICRDQKINIRSGQFSYVDGVMLYYLENKQP